MKRLRSCGSVAIFTCVLAACGPDLGACPNPSVSAQTVYYLDGVPYYAGQALVHQSCAGSFCHAAGAKDAARIGAPHELSFDVAPLLAASTAHDVKVLQRGIAKIREEADNLYSAVDDGEMPPGAAGKRPALAWMIKDASQALVPATLPKVGSAAGKKMLREWLACDAPIVAYTTGAPGQDKGLGTVLPKEDVVVEPTFDSLYGAVLGGVCASCHNEDAANPFKDATALDFATADAAYASLVDKDALASGVCSGRKLVSKGDCMGSLLHEKLLPEAEQPATACGAPMPQGGPEVSSQVLDALCMWIDSGAAR